MAEAGYYPDPFEKDGAGRVRWYGGGAWAPRTIPAGGPEDLPEWADDLEPETYPVSDAELDDLKARSGVPARSAASSPGSSPGHASAGTVGGQLIGWIAVLLLVAAGLQMLGLESVAGNTVAEEFYNLVGLAILGGAGALASSLLRSA